MTMSAYVIATSALEELLDSILNANRVFSASFLFSAFSNILPKSSNFEFVFREARRFPSSLRDSADPFLYFPFLSFEWCDGKIRRFSALDEIAARVDELKSRPDRQAIEHEKLLCFVPTDATCEFLTMVRTASRCMGVFYYTCGGHDHFIGNVAARFVRDYFKQEKRFDVADIVQAIEKQCRVRAIYASAIGKRIAVISDPTNVYNELRYDTRFNADLQSSIDKRVGVTGHTADNRFNYAIHTLAHEYFDHSRPLIEAAGKDGSEVERNFAYATRGVVVTASEMTQLDLDVLSFTPRIFRAYINDRIFAAREEFFSSLLRRGGRLADALLLTPVSTADQLREKLYPLLDEACGVLVELTFASSVVIRAFDPFTRSLVRVGQCRQFELKAPEALSVIPADDIAKFASARAFTLQLQQGLDGSRQAEILPSFDFGEIVEADGHVASIPIRVGAIVLGTIDFYTNGRRFFANDRQYLAVAADSIGELIRRVEAANDAAWLSRLSFLHSARHRLERFRRRVATKDQILADELDEIFRLYSSFVATSSENDLASFSRDLRLIALSHKVPPEDANAFVAKVEPAFSPKSVPPLSRLLFREVIDNLLHNARVHTDVRISDISVTFLGTDDALPSAILVHYKDTEATPGTGVIERICVSPIERGKDSKGASSYHFGLFLLACQLRMAGGYASGPRGNEVAMSGAPFEVIFGIPLTESKDDEHGAT